MSLFNVFSVAGSALTAQSARLNATASNLANADSVVSADGKPYRAKQVVFKAAPVTNDGGIGVRVAGMVDSAAPGRLVRVDDNTSVSPGPTVVAPSRGENTTQGAVLLTASDRDLWVLTRQDWTSPSEDQRSRATTPRVTTTMRVERRDRRTGDILSVHELGTRAPEDKPLPGFPPRRPDQLILLDSGRVLLATSASGTFEINPIDP